MGNVPLATVPPLSHRGNGAKGGSHTEIQVPISRDLGNQGPEMDFTFPFLINRQREFASPNTCLAFTDAPIGSAADSRAKVLPCHWNGAAKEPSSHPGPGLEKCQQPLSWAYHRPGALSWNVLTSGETEVQTRPSLKVTQEVLVGGLPSPTLFPLCASVNAACSPASPQEDSSFRRVCSSSFAQAHGTPLGQPHEEACLCDGPGKAASVDSGPAFSLCPGQHQEGLCSCPG